MACVWQNPKSPYWIAQFTSADGRRVNRSTKQRDRRKAQKIADAWEDAAVKARSHELTQAASTKILSDLMELTIHEKLKVESIEDCLNGYIASRKTLGRSEGTAKRYEAIVSSFLEFLNAGRRKASVASLSTAEIEAWRDAELASGKGGTTVDFGIKVLRAILSAARRRGVILSNPAEAVEMVGDAAESKDPFPAHELKALLRVASLDWKGMILLGVWCGPRLEDAANSTRENIDLEAHTYTIWPKKTSRRSSKPLVIAMHPELVEHFRSLPPSIGKAPLFPSLYGRKAGSHGGLSNEFARLMERAGVAITLGKEKTGKGRQSKNKGYHSLRHTMISRMANAEISADVRKAMAGHSSDSAHKRYVHLNVETQRAAVRKLPRIS